MDKKKLREEMKKDLLKLIDKYSKYGLIPENASKLMGGDIFEIKIHKIKNEEGEKLSDVDYIFLPRGILWFLGDEEMTDEDIDILNEEDYKEKLEETAERLFNSEVE